MKQLDELKHQYIDKVEAQAQKAFNVGYMKVVVKYNIVFSEYSQR